MERTTTLIPVGGGKGGIRAQFQQPTCGVGVAMLGGAVQGGAAVLVQPVYAEETEIDALHAIGAATVVDHGVPTSRRGLVDGLRRRIGRRGSTRKWCG